jgi:hypothetical protein
MVSCTSCRAFSFLCKLVTWRVFFVKHVRNRQGSIKHPPAGTQMECATRVGKRMSRHGLRRLLHVSCSTLRSSLLLEAPSRHSARECLPLRCWRDNSTNHTLARLLALPIGVCNAIPPLSPRAPLKYCCRQNSNSIQPLVIWTRLFDRRVDMYTMFSVHTVGRVYFSPSRTRCNSLRFLQLLLMCSKFLWSVHLAAMFNAPPPPPTHTHTGP